jgi:uncharacterized membrane protein YhiD involved in acid resistance
VSAGELAHLLHTDLLLQLALATVLGGIIGLERELKCKRGPRRLHEQALVALMHHPAVRRVSTGE